MKTDLILLSRSEIKQLLTLPDCIKAMEDAFRRHAEGLALKPALMHIDSNAGEFHIKGGGLQMEQVYFGLKANGGFFSNRIKYGLPNIIGLILLFDGENGRPLAVMDSVDITILRTGATTALAARHLARADSKTVTICGCGIQGRIQLQALREVLPNLARAFAWDQDKQTAENYAAQMGSRMGFPVTAADLAEAASQSDIIVTCTPAKVFYLRREYIRPGTFIAAVGADSPDKQEVEPSLLASSRLVVDIFEQCARVGELHHALNAGLMTETQVHAELGEIVAGIKPGRSTAQEITIFDTTGSAIQDTAAALLVYKKALARSIGRTIDLYQ